jgi:hypothetical protein
MNYPHDHLSVVSQSELEVIPRLHTGHVDELYSPSWDVLASSLVYHAGAETPEDGQHRFSSKHVVVSEQFRDFGYLDFWPGRSVVSSAYALMSRIHREFKYVTGSTTINTTVLCARDAQCVAVVGIVRALCQRLHADRPSTWSTQTDWCRRQPRVGVLVVW